MIWSAGVFRGALSWALLMPRDISLLDSWKYAWPRLFFSRAVRSHRYALLSPTVDTLLCKFCCGKFFCRKLLWKSSTLVASCCENSATFFEVAVYFTHFLLEFSENSVVKILLLWKFCNFCWSIYICKACNFYCKFMCKSCTFCCKLLCKSCNSYCKMLRKSCNLIASCCVFHVMFAASCCVNPSTYLQVAAYFM